MQTRAAIDSLYRKLAERVGFEPTNTVRCYTLSRRAPSTARPPLHKPLLKLHTGWDCSRLRRESSASLRTDEFASSSRPPLRAAARVPEVTRAIKFKEAQSPQASEPWAPGVSARESRASRWPPYWAAPAD